MGEVRSRLTVLFEEPFWIGVLVPSLTDIARYKSDASHDVVKNWLRSRETIEFLGLWESLHNPAFKQVEFDGFRDQAGLNAVTMSPTKWIEGVNAIGIVSKAGRYGGTYAHSDIAFEFASWISAEFNTENLLGNRLPSAKATENHDELISVEYLDDIYVVYERRIRKLSQYGP